MNRFSHREIVPLVYAASPASSSPQAVTARNSDVDFNDVFGGPPRRSSIQEIRYSSVDVNSPNEEKPLDEFPSCSWPRALTASEKPVFGEESSHRRRKPSDDFFDDIFCKDESSSSTPKWGYERERDTFASSTPGSSPAHPLHPRAEIFLSSSVPSSSSLSARGTKGTDFPTFGSPTRSLHTKNNNYSKDGAHHSPTRFQDSKQFYRQSPLSQAAATSHGNEVFSKMTSEEKEEKTKLKQELSDSNIQFHFSIYKWASKGVPFAIPFKQGKEKGRNVTYLISKDQFASATPQTGSDSPSACSTSSTTLKTNEDYESSSQVYEILTGEMVDKATVLKDPSATSDTLHESTKPIQVNKVVSGQSRKETSSASANACGNTTKSQLRPLHSLFSESDEEVPAGNGEIRKGDGARQSKTKHTNKSTSVFNTGITKENEERKRTVPEAVNVDKFLPQVAESTSFKNPEKNVVKGKVNDFVRLFNQESSPKAKEFVVFHRQEKTPNRNPSGEVNRIQENLRQSDKEKAVNATEVPDISLNPVHEHTGIKVAETDQYLQSNFLIEELAREETNLLETQDNHEEIKAIDAKVRKWSNGKEGNIRSLLSTLQYVLWPGSGWKTVPLVDLIEGSSVKRSYQRALLCLHPDKLQQKGAATHQKYTAEKVFDILQEAWNQFNLLGAV